MRLKSVHPFDNLVQIAANVAKQVIHFPYVGVVHIIDKTIKYQFPEKCRFAFHFGNPEFLIQNVLLAII